MQPPPNIAAARRFLSLFDNGTPVALADLSQALDSLALAYHETPAGDPTEEDVEPPARDYQATYQSLKTQLPSLGLYAMVFDPRELDAEPMLGDALDDVADIIGDLSEVVWRFESVSADDAHWHFRFLFEVHWGRHLRELSFYLHTQLYQSGEG